jgi:uncharacterized membrane protein YfcA
MILDHVAQILALSACVVIIVRAEGAINRMTRRTPMLVRSAFWLLLVGAAGAAAGILLSGEVPPWPAVFGAWGAALMLYCERRLRYLTQTPKGGAEA